MLLDTGGESLHRPHIRSSAVVYEEAILHRTRAVLRGRDRIVEPADLDELIQVTYGEELPPGCSADEQEALKEADALAAQARRQITAEADEITLGAAGAARSPWARGTATLGDADGASAAAYVARTRRNDLPAVSLVLLFPHELPATARLEPNRADTVELLRRAVNVSDQRIVGPLLASARGVPGAAARAFQPEAWRRNAHLRDAVLVELDAAGVAQSFSTAPHVSVSLTYDLVQGVRDGSVSD